MVPSLWQQKRKHQEKVTWYRKMEHRRKTREKRIQQQHKDIRSNGVPSKGHGKIGITHNKAVQDLEERHRKHQVDKRLQLKNI